MHNGTSVLLKKIMNLDRSELWRSKLNLHGYLEKKNRNRDFTLRIKNVECHLYNILFINM